MSWAKHENWESFLWFCQCHFPLYKSFMRKSLVMWLKMEINVLSSHCPTPPGHQLFTSAQPYKEKRKKKKLSDGNCDFLFSVNFHSFFWKIDLKRKKNVNFPSVLFTISLIYTSLTWKTFSILPSPSQISMFVFGLCLFRMKYVKRKLLQFENEFVFMLSKLIDNLKLVFSSRSTLITSKVYCDPAPLEQNAHLFVPGARMCVLFGTPK